MRSGTSSTAPPVRWPPLRDGLAGTDPDELVVMAPSSWDLRRLLERWEVHQAPQRRLHRRHPAEVCDRLDVRWRDRGGPLRSYEGFLRQVCGWREYCWATTSCSPVWIPGS